METIRLSHWEDFRDLLNSQRFVVPVYWRGQTNPDWPLASSFERTILKMNGGDRPGAAQVFPYDGRYERNGRKTWTDSFVETIRNSYLTRFKRAASGLRGPNPAPLGDVEWWALGRHHGLISPLLDWTEKPYIAAFFALSGLLEEMISQSGGALVFEGREVAIYRLVHREQLEGQGLRVHRATIDELPHLAGQRSVFTWLSSEDYFELEGFLDAKQEGNLLTQVLLSDQALTDGLRDLRDHGIDYRLLFPDLSGAARQANDILRDNLANLPQF